MTRRNQPLAQQLVLIETPERPGDGVDVGGADEDGGRADDLGHRAHGGGDDGDASRHRLDQRQPEPLVVRRVQDKRAWL